MKWYYAKRGKIGQHGLVDDEVLREMARKGEICPDDLLWRHPDGKSWARAASVAGLCPEPEPQVAKDPGPERDADVSEGPVADKVVAPEQQKQSQKALVAGMVVILLVILVLAILAGTGNLPSIFKADSEAEEMSEIEPIGQPTKTTADWAKIASDIELYIEKQNISEAEKLLTEMSKAVGESEIVNSLSARLTLLKHSLARLDNLKKDLLAGTLNEDQAADFVKLYAKYNKGSDGLAEEIEGMASSPEFSATACLSAVKVARVLKDDALARSLLMAAADRSDAATSWTICLAVVAECDKEGLKSSSVRVLRSFLDANPESSNAWYQKAVRLSQQNDEDGALEALEFAVKFGTERVKVRARGDERFQSLKDNRRFKHLTK